LNATEQFICERHYDMYWVRAMFMPDETWSRFVLSGTNLIPGELQVNDPALSRMDTMVEIRRPDNVSLPIEVLKQLSRSCQRLLVDPHTFDHQELIDCLMLGSTLVCIDHRSDIKQLELAHASSANIVVKLELDQSMLSEPEEHLSLLESLSSHVGDLIMVKTRMPGILEEWWLILPRRIRGAWKWIMAPAEGERITLPHRNRIHSWAISGDLFIK